jgi:hypothetical protein
MSRRERHTSTWFGSFLPSPAMIVSYQQMLRTLIWMDIGIDVSGRRWNGGEAKVVLVGDLMSS